jgi:hypothetical protein
LKFSDKFPIREPEKDVSGKDAKDAKINFPNSDLILCALGGLGAINP